MAKTIEELEVNITVIRNRMEERREHIKASKDLTRWLKREHRADLDKVSKLVRKLHRSNEWDQAITGKTLSSCADGVGKDAVACTVVEPMWKTNPEKIKAWMKDPDFFASVVKEFDDMDWKDKIRFSLLYPDSELLVHPGDIIFSQEERIAYVGDRILNDAMTLTVAHEIVDHLDNKKPE